MSIQPSEAWRLDFVELMQLTDQETNKKSDISTMLNFERKANGATNEWLNGGDLSQKV